jgi:hypothetical protein
VALSHLPPAALEDTVRRYNQIVEVGEGREFVPISQLTELHLTPEEIEYGF